jgi:diguanylate cyclase (GGDEF)-like protein/PAS domain S-box-containing protein
MGDPSRVQCLRAQRAVSRALASVADPTSAAAAALRAVCEATGASEGAIWVLNRPGPHPPNPSPPSAVPLAAWPPTSDPVAPPSPIAARNGRPTTARAGARANARGPANGRSTAGGRGAANGRVSGTPETGCGVATVVPVEAAGGVAGALVLALPLDPADPTAQREREELLSTTALLLAQLVERLRAEDAAGVAVARASALLDLTLDAVLTLDEAGCLLDLNAAAERLFGRRREELSGKRAADVLLPRGERAAGAAALLDLMGGESPAEPLRLMAVRASGAQFPLELRLARIDPADRRDPAGAGLFVHQPTFAALVRDISEPADAEMAFLARHDALTCLPNRTTFEEMTEMALARASRQELAVCVLSIDLDNFKMVNDSLGHRAGDELLRQVAGRLREASRETDLVARPGGDEFLLLLSDLQRSVGGPSTRVDNALMVAETVASRVHDCLRRPFDLTGSELYLSASVGVSIYPADATDARSLLNNAEAAMYRSKRLGPGGYVVSPAGVDRSSRKLSLATRLRRAAEERRWVLHYQPLLDLSEGRITGVEALLRWEEPDLGVIPPTEFIPLAEEMGLIEPIGDWLLEELLRQAWAWRLDGLELDVSFNLSARQVWDPGFARWLLGRLASSRVDPSRLIVEITESAAMTDPDRTSEVLASLRGAGLRFAIDDFGTGYSSLSRLHELPVDILKIDRSFVAGLPDAPSSATMVHAIIQLAHSLGIASLAEGVETKDQWRFLVEQGCQLGQGFFFSPAVPPDDVLGLARLGTLPPPRRRVASRAGARSTARTA